MIFKQISTVKIFKSFIPEMRLDLGGIINHIIHQKHIGSIANILIEDHFWKGVKIKAPSILIDPTKFIIWSQELLNNFFYDYLAYPFH